ncbi:hypothetical protein [Roseibium sp.]|uniref:hypothetical protein n=1 Tax=Roseibium sp. TaxID=1936156 RepID=UPI003BB041D3
MSGQGAGHPDRRCFLSLAATGTLALALPTRARAITNGANSAAISVFRCPASPSSFRTIAKRKSRKGLMSQKVLRSGYQLTVIEEWNTAPITTEFRYLRLEL